MNIINSTKKDMLAVCLNILHHILQEKNNLIKNSNFLQVQHFYLYSSKVNKKFKLKKLILS